MSSSLISDLNRLLSIVVPLTASNEKDIINFINNQEQCRRRWEQTEKDIQALKENEIPLQEEHKLTSVQLELARNQLDHALRKRTEYEKRIRYLEQQLLAIQAHLNDVDPEDIKGFDRNAILRMADLCDRKYEEKIPQLPIGRKSVIPSDLDNSTEETTETQLVRAASNARSYKKKVDEDYIFSKRTSIDTIQSYEPMPMSISPYKISELPKPALGYSNNDNFQDHDTHVATKSILQYQTMATNVDGKSSPRENKLYPDIISTASSAVIPASVLESDKPIVTYASKPHNLILKKEIKPGKCSLCHKGIGFQKLFYRCQDCNIKCHEDCKKFISTVCEVETDKIILRDSVENSLPFRAPLFIVQIVTEIEKRGLSEQGLYRVSGSLKDIKEFKKQIKKKHEIDFSKIPDVHTLTHLLKAYLRELTEPLITRQLHAPFMECGEKNDLPRVYKLIDTLPIQNRHTLAYLILHFRKVARVQQNLMDFKSLARVLGPSIIGHGCLNPSNSRLYEDTRVQPMLMELLLGISDDYWNIVLGLDDNCTLQKTILSPIKDGDKSKYDISVGNNSPLLGRIDKIQYKKRNWAPQYPVDKSNLTKWRKQKFFDSPAPRN